MPINKNSFQPKDARAFSSIYHQDIDDEMDELFNTSNNNEKVQGKKVMTGTQALVEFLKTTSPEEFQHSNSNGNKERSSNIFSRIRKQKIKTNNMQSTSPPIPTTSISSRSVPSSTASLPVTLTSSTLTAPTSYHGSEINSNNSTINRKNYIEIVPQKMISKSAGNSRSPSFETTTTSIQSFVLRNSNNNNNGGSNNKGEPILPNKKRESSLYSGSLRHSVSIKSQLSNSAYNRYSQRTTKIDESKATEDYIIKSDGMDMIESALLQRLERFKILSHDLPSDQVATGLATEHVRALGITHTLDNIINNQHHEENIKSKNQRHMQVQTDHYIENSTSSNTSSQGNDTDAISIATTATATEEQDFEKRAKRAEAALENALDHFEVISGLAYKKLREIWEEKMRWENACMELRDRLVVLEQKKYPFQQQQQQQQQQGFHPSNDYFLEEHEEEDELGLSEFPCSE